MKTARECSVGDWMRTALLLSVLLPTSALSSQTFTPTQAVSATICRDRLGLSRTCTDITTDRITRQYTETKLGRKLFATIGGMASNCLRADPNQPNECAYSLSVWTDPLWNRVVWGVPDKFVKSFGAGGVGAGQFIEPRGVALTNRDYNGYGVFVADASNNRIAVLRIQLGSTSQTMTWVTEITGEESGTRLSRPASVAWDPAGSKPTNNDRLFILDSGNGRVLVYKINFDLLNGTFTKTYLGQFGARGSGNRQLLEPTDIAVRSSQGYSPAGYSDVVDVAIADNGNKRVAHWEYIITDPYAPAPRVGAVFETFPSQGGDITGVTMDHYRDIIATDRTRNLLLKYDRDMNLVVTYGGTASWSTGSFLGPSVPRVMYAYGDPSGLYIEAGLAYVGTAEHWTDNSGIQLHRLSNELIGMNLTKNDSAKTATITFVLTAGGSFQPYILNAAGSIVRWLPWVTTGSGVHMLHWDGYLDNGTRASGGVDYRFAVQYFSGYPYNPDDGRTAYSPAFRFPGTVSPIRVALLGPRSVDPYVSNQWSVSVDGVPPFQYQWRKNGSSVGNGTTYSTSAPRCEGFDLSVTVTDAANQKGSDGFYVANRNENDPSCAPPDCPPDEPWCVDPMSAPPSYEFGQSYEEVDGGASVLSMPSFSLYGVVGLKRTTPPFAPTKANAAGMARDRSAIVKALRERGITQLRFGVPRASDQAAAADRARTRLPNQSRDIRQGDSDRVARPGETSGTAARTARANRGSVGDNVPVTIQIYDLGGRLVRTAVRATLEPGYYQYEWDGRNDAGLAMAPGVYVAVMSAPSFAHRTKLILAR